MKWLLLLTKRSFKKLSFIFILLLMPAVTLAITQMTRDSGILDIGYVCDGEPDAVTEEIFHTLSRDGGILEFVPYNSVEEAQKDLEDADLDVLWIFPHNMYERIRDYHSGDESSVMTVLEREESVISSLAREKLFCVLYPHLSFSMFSDYMKSNIPDGDKLTDSQMKEYFSYKGIDSNIVEVRTVDASGSLSEPKGDHLTSPLRGMLSVILLLSGLASAAYTLSDKKRGLFAPFSPMKRLKIYLLSVLSSVIPASISFMLSLCAAGLWESPVTELIRTAALVSAVTALSVAFAVILDTPERMGAVIPLTVIAATVFSPIFLNLHIFPAVQYLFPTYHYLHSVTDLRSIVMLLLYSAVLWSVSAVIQAVRSHR